MFPHSVPTQCRLKEKFASIPSNSTNVPREKVVCHHSRNSCVPNKAEATVAKRNRDQQKPLWSCSGACIVPFTESFRIWALGMEIRNDEVVL
jgi:hypothetical protein